MTYNGDVNSYSLTHSLTHSLLSTLSVTQRHGWRLVTTLPENRKLRFEVNLLSSRQAHSSLIGELLYSLGFSTRLGFFLQKRAIYKFTVIIITVIIIGRSAGQLVSIQTHGHFLCFRWWRCVCLSPPSLVFSRRHRWPQYFVNTT